MFIVSIFFVLTSLKAQQKLSLEATGGWIYSDLFYGLIDDHYTYNMHFDLTVWNSFQSSKKFSPRIGAGYSYMWALLSRNRRNTHYFTVKVGSDYTINKRVKFTGSLNSYFVLNGESDFLVIRERERRFFLNFNPGFRIKVGSRSEFVVSSPISLTPTYQDEFRVLTGPDPGANVTIWSGWIGLNIGLNYAFGGG